MATNIKLYTNTSRRNVFDKQNTLTERFSLSIQFKDDVDILNPVIRLVYNSEYITKNVNYVYIEDFNRYYFIDKVELINHEWVCHCHVDVLYTYKTQIKECEGIAGRSTHNYNQFITDGEYCIENDERVMLKKFPNSFEKNLQLCLVTLGG